MTASIRVCRSRVTALGVRGMSREEVEAIVDEILDASKDLIDTRGEGAENTLMGRAMERLRGHADGRLVSEVLRSRLQARLPAKKGRKKKE